MANKLTERQIEIVEAAGKILTKVGISGLTTKNLAKEMQFSESALYRHFENKESIILGLLQYLAWHMEQRLSNLADEAALPEEKFIRIFNNQFDFFKQNPHFVVAVFSDGLLEESEKINQAISQIMEVKMKHLMPILLEGQKQNIFTNKIPAAHLLHIVLGTFRLHMYKWRVANFEFDLHEQGNKVIHSILMLLKTN